MKRTIEDKINDLNDIFTTKQEHWGERVKKCIALTDRLEDVPMAQLEMMNIRHDLTVEIWKLRSKQRTFDAVVAEKRLAVLDELKTQSNILYEYKEKQTAVESRLRFYIVQQNAVRSQLEFYEQVRNTIDRLSYVITNRIKLAESEGI